MHYRTTERQDWVLLSLGCDACGINIDITHGSEGCEALEFQIYGHKCAFQIQMSMSACTGNLGLPGLTGQDYKKEPQNLGEVAGLMVFFFFFFFFFFISHDIS